MGEQRRGTGASQLEHRMYRSFASLRMTAFRFVVIPSAAKDLCVSLSGCIDRTSDYFSFLPNMNSLLNT